jgi:hypothetical protein
MKNIGTLSKKLSAYRDSCPQTEPVYIDTLRRMGGEKRLRVAFELYEIALNLCRQSITEQNPNIAEEELKQKSFERFGYDTGRRAGKGNR